MDAKILADTEIYEQAKATWGDWIEDVDLRTYWVLGWKRMRKLLKTEKNEKLVPEK
jgi:hypothetical protein